LIPDAQLRVLEGDPDQPTGHLLIIQKPAGLADMITAHAGSGTGREAAAAMEMS
jgi:hypothetical protein